MAVDATARLYDVDEDSVVFTRSRQKDSYDQGTVKFRARKGKLVELDKLHESIWATRLSGGTKSGVVDLQVTAIGEVRLSAEQAVLKVADSPAEFVLAKHDSHADVFQKLSQLTDANHAVRVTGVIDGYVGRWPGVLKTKPTNPRRILVTNVEIEE